MNMQDTIEVHCFAPSRGLNPRPGQNETATDPFSHPATSVIVDVKLYHVKIK